MRTEAASVFHQAGTGWLFRFFNRFSVKSLLLGGVSLGILFTVLVAVYLKATQGATIRMMDSLVNVENVVSDLCLKSDSALHMARQQEKDFLLNYLHYGLDESTSRYITRLEYGVEEIMGNMARIRTLAADPAVTRLTLETHSALEQYRTGVESVARKYGERGSPETGVSGAMRAEADRIEELLETSGSYPLSTEFAAARRAQASYLEREKDVDAAAVETAVRQFMATAARFPQALRRELGDRSERYLGFFREYVRLTEEIRSAKREYLRAVRTIELRLESLYTGSLARVAAHRQAIEKSMRLMSLPIVVGGGLGLALAALLSLGVALTVARAVVESEAFAAKIAAGNLGTRLAPSGRNEFFVLQTALNAMAESLQNAETARRAGSAALRESEEKYRAFVETSTDWIWAADREGRYTYTNDRVRDILGIEPEQLLQTSTLSLLHPEDAPRIQELLARNVASGTGWQCQVLRWRHRDGTWRWVESNAVALKDAEGNLAGFRGTDRNITERRQLEIELGKAQRLEAVGTLAGGIAHDFNNLLQGLFGYVSLAKLSLAPGDKALAMLEQAEKALTLSVNLTTQLLTFSKGGLPAKKRIALRSLLEDPVRFALSGSSSNYRLNVDRDLWAVDADGGQLAQVIQNLVLNASEAMPHGGTVEVSARNESLSAGSNPLVPTGGAFVRIDVKDCGVGIDEQNLARIFEPYFTTKQKGSGLGLASSYSIVRNHGGFIDVRSRTGEGSVFSIYLPACGSPEAGATQADPRPAELTGKILVMDDEVLVRQVAEGMLSALGHEVQTTASGEEALALFCAAREEGRPFDVVILDLTVKKGLGGEETIRRLLELDPQVRAVVSSGYSSSAIVADYRAHGFSAFLNKPYHLDALKDCLQSLLSPRGSAA